MSFLIAAGIIAYFAAGHGMAKASLQTWKNGADRNLEAEDRERAQTGWRARLLFPWSSSNGKVGQSSSEYPILVEDVPEKHYIALMCLFWPFKVVWNVVPFALFTILHVGSLPGRILDASGRLLTTRRAPAALPAGEPKAQPPPNLEVLPDEQAYLELDRLEREHVAALEATRAKKAEIESRLGETETKKLIAMPRRL